MIEIYLIRHGIAAKRGTYADDEQRPLVDRGIKKTTQVANSLRGSGLKFDLILTSPLVRAAQTAAILKQAGLSTKITTFLALKPEGDIAELLTWLQEWQTNQPNGKLALVGHQPDLGNWTEMLVWGAVTRQIVIKKAGVVGLKLPNIGTPIARSTLFLLLSPKYTIRLV